MGHRAGVCQYHAGRALCGESGQRLQALLTAAGLTTRYLILRTVPVDTSDLTAAQRNKLVDDPAVRALHTEVFSRVVAANSGLAALLAVGPGAQRLAPNIASPAWGRLIGPRLSMRCCAQATSRI